MRDSADSGKTHQSERALRALRSRILSGEFLPDQHISETAAADLLGISRTPMREAMARLVEEGLLSRTETGRCTVRRHTRRDVVDAIEVRGVLEGTLVRIAAERGPEPAAFARCQEIAAEIDAALGTNEAVADFQRYTELNAQFHDTLAALSGSETLEREVLRSYRLPLASPNALLHSHFNVPDVRRSLFRGQEQHKDILAAIASREGARAEAIAREHARLARINLDYVMLDNQDLAEMIPGLSMVTAAESNMRSDRPVQQGRRE
ncbi:GntR family transcriptional regulator [Algicella marina]|uniref:FCD domain-containing protein n=1 Tax=Algicella marina TaxID=2683284 RepID=A0A6P1T436_9RHOB|nr:GntR family transcriptional regulator [Algicella marina]QHQ36521.1 FCD domain-containing protein [Algicella marina]